MERLVAISLLFTFASITESHHGSAHYHWSSNYKNPVTAGSAEETKSLDQLYAEALAEGGRVIVYAGGDTPGQQDRTKAAFEERFPGMTADVIVDYSKYHDARIDNQIATNRLIPDVVILQTLQDFPRWKEQGVLMKYKPKGFGQVFEPFKDSDGYYTGLYLLVFSILVSPPLLPNNATWPKTSLDLLKPQFKDQKLILAFPNDDDAVLFWFYQKVQKYGWSYLDAFVKQNPVYVRGTQEPGDQLRAGNYPVAVAVAGGIPSSANSTSYLILPEGDDPFVSWPQTGAIFKNATRPAAAKLWMNWFLSTEYQANKTMWPVRKDVPKPGYPNALNIPNSDSTAFAKWMADRGAVERFKQQVTLYVGEVKGEPSPGHPGLYPEQALPH